MKRDGNSFSLWQDKIPAYEATNPLPQENTPFDVLIVGGGITGIATGLQLVKAGKKVLIAESHNLGFGTTGGTTAHLNSFLESPFNQVIKRFGEKNAQLIAKALRQALDLIKTNIKEYEIDCGYKELPGYIFSQDAGQSQELDDILEASKKLGVDAAYSDTIPVNIPFEKAIRLEAQGQFHPVRYIYALAKEFEKKGGIIAENCRVTAVDETQVLTVTTSRGNFRATNLIYATHIPPGVNLLHFRCAPYRSYAIAYKLKEDKDYPDALVYDMYDPYHYYRTQEIDGEKYFIAGGEDHKTGHEENAEGRFLKVDAYVRKFFEIDSIAFRWSSQFFDPADGIAYIGHLPGHPTNMFVATGYGGIGMSNSHIAALMLTDMIVAGKSEYQSVFNPNRIKPVAGFSNFVKESADVVAKMFGSILPKEKLESLVELAPGEGKVVRYENHKIALYKDQEGNLHAINPACTHVKCEVSWNNAERSWDCPCHGSRFSAEGEVLTAPARKDLEVIELAELIEK